jgi:hypothetical protein
LSLAREEHHADPIGSPGQLEAQQTKKNTCSTIARPALHVNQKASAKAHRRLDGLLKSVLVCARYAQTAQRTQALIRLSRRAAVAVRAGLARVFSRMSAPLKLRRTERRSFFIPRAQRPPPSEPRTAQDIDE